MDIQATKIELVQRLLNTSSTEILEKVKSIFDKEESDWWDELPKEVQDEIDQSLKEVDEGKGIPHEEVMAEMRKKYPHLHR